MIIDILVKLLHEDMDTARRAVSLLRRSVERAKKLHKDAETRNLTIDELEVFEALTSRYGRAIDFITSKLFRTIDRVELSDDGTVLDRINRFKKRGVLRDDVNYALLKDLRNRIVHEYVIEANDQVVTEVIAHAELIFEMLRLAEVYCREKGFIGSRSDGD
jgi:hypothetical protein